MTKANANAAANAQEQQAAQQQILRDLLALGQGFFCFSIAIGLRPSVVLSLYCHVRSHVRSALPAYAIGHAKNIRKGLGNPKGFVVITYPPIAKRTERKRSCVRRRCRRRFMTAP